MSSCGIHCPLCVEFKGEEESIFNQLIEAKLDSRIVRKTDKYLAFPPLGQFVEGSLLLATQEHVMSFAHIEEKDYQDLEEFLEHIVDMVTNAYEAPIVFEHGPMSSSHKGTCCVDHAHFNIFPVAIDIHSYLKSKFEYKEISTLAELQEQREKNMPYLFVQDNNEKRYIYEVEVIPSQYIRQIIAKELGIPERWHWREYIGEEEFLATLKTYGLE